MLRPKRRTGLDALMHGLGCSHVAAAGVCLAVSVDPVCLRHGGLLGLVLQAMMPLVCC